MMDCPKKPSVFLVLAVCKIVSGAEDPNIPYASKGVQVGLMLG